MGRSNLTASRKDILYSVNESSVLTGDCVTDVHFSRPLILGDFRAGEGVCSTTERGRWASDDNLQPLRALAHLCRVPTVQLLCEVGGKRLSPSFYRRGSSTDGRRVFVMVHPER